MSMKMVNSETKDRIMEALDNRFKAGRSRSYLLHCADSMSYMAYLKECGVDFVAIPSDKPFYMNIYTEIDSPEFSDKHEQSEARKRAFEIYLLTLPLPPDWQP